MDTSRECKESRREIRRRRLKNMNGDTYGGKTEDEDYEEDGGEKINEHQMRMRCEKSRKKKWIPA